ncbi:MAG: hypothetical protein ACRDJM_11375 [Actinomycetota bacterium]
MDERTLTEARAVAEEEGVSFSSWLSEAARDRLRLRGLRRQIAKFEAEHGEISDEELAKVRREIETARPRRRRSRAG